MPAKTCSCWVLQQRDGAVVGKYWGILRKKRTAVSPLFWQKHAVPRVIKKQLLSQNSCCQHPPSSKRLLQTVTPVVNTLGSRHPQVHHRGLKEAVAQGHPTGRPWHPPAMGLAAGPLFLLHLPMNQHLQVWSLLLLLTSGGYVESCRISLCS